MWTMLGLVFGGLAEQVHLPHRRASAAFDKPSLSYKMWRMGDHYVVKELAAFSGLLSR